MTDENSINEAELEDNAEAAEPKNPRLFDIHEGIDLNLRWATAIVDLMTTGDPDDESVREGADAACQYLREAKRNVDLLHEWWAQSKEAH